MSLSSKDQKRSNEWLALKGSAATDIDSALIRMVRVLSEPHHALSGSTQQSYSRWLDFSLPNLRAGGMGYRPETDNGSLLSAAVGAVGNPWSLPSKNAAQFDYWLRDSTDKMANFTPTAYENAFFFGKQGLDTNNGNNPERPTLTLAQARTLAEARAAVTSDRVLVQCLDNQTYTGDITTGGGQIDYNMRYATVEDCQVSMVGNSYVQLNELYLDPAPATPIAVAKSGAGSLSGVFEANVVDGRGAAGTVTGGALFVNLSASSILFVTVHKAFVAANQVGVGDVSSGIGHIHSRFYDLYLAGNNAIGVQGVTSGSFTFCIVDHILEFGSHTGTIGVDSSNSGSLTYVRAHQIIADTAITVGNGGFAYIDCQQIFGNINVDAGGTLYINCLNHASGTVTNNGTIQGRIGGNLYNTTVLP